jgi:signal transduction histidine kinase
MVAERERTAAPRERVATQLRRGPTAASPDGADSVGRPGIFVLLFWTALIAAVVTWNLNVLDEVRRYGAVPVASAVAVTIAAWSWLPWDPRTAGLRRLLALPLFAAAVFVLCQATNVLWALPLYSIAVADGVFLFGFGRGILVAALTLPLVFAGGYLYLPDDVRLTGTAFLVGIMVPMAAFVLGICKALVETEHRRQQTRALLEELETANAALQRQSGKVRELAISEERARLAREVHDALGHHLTAINLQLQNAERFADRDPARSRAKVREARQSTLSALAEVRRSVRALKPPGLEERSGVAAIAALARSFNGLGPDVSFQVEGSDHRLSEDVELVLYRTTQEGLTNAAKHSQARRVRVALMIGTDYARLTIADDGVGQQAADHGFGLVALRERVEAVGGTLTAENRSEGGFALEVVVPTGASAPQPSSEEIERP